MAQILAEVIVELFGWLPVFDNLTLQVCDLQSQALRLNICCADSGLRGMNGVPQALKLVQGGRDGVGLQPLSRRANPCLEIVARLVVLLDDSVQMTNRCRVHFRETDCEFEPLKRLGLFARQDPHQRVEELLR